LEHEVTLSYAKSSHDYQQELVEMLEGLKSTSDKIQIKETDEVSPIPKLALEYKGEATGVMFLGVPGGHEFTSLVLAILNADGKDVTVINISITDDKGREVPTANNMISFTISENAKIIGVGNGDPSSHEADMCKEGNWQRSAFNGKCQVIIQSGKNVGDIKLEAKSNGLKSGAVLLQLKK
jgi:hypothetical protein